MIILFALQVFAAAMAAFLLLLTLNLDKFMRHKENS